METELVREEERAGKLAAKKHARRAKREAKLASSKRQQAEQDERRLRCTEARRSIAKTKQALRLKQSKIKLLEQSLATAKGEYKSKHKAVVSSTKSRDKLAKELKCQTLLLAKLIKDRERCAKSKAALEGQIAQEKEAHREAQAEVDAASKMLRELAPKDEVKAAKAVQKKHKKHKKHKVLKKPVAKSGESRKVRTR